ncbi:Uncharacterised protein [Klebsiella pneumoniae]|nr:Uncharacterised protein [Klebsiella pneumoniae]
MITVNISSQVFYNWLPDKTIKSKTITNPLMKK